MDIIDPVVLGDVACTRASPKYVYDRNGLLVQVPANTLGVTYDPTDLTKAPYALIEPAATNLQPNSETFALWSVWNAASVENSIAVAPDGTLTADAINFAAVNSGVYSTLTTLTPGATYTMSFFLRADSPGTITILGSTTSAGQLTVSITTSWQRFSTTYTAGDAADGPFIARLAGDLARVYAWGGSEEPGALSSYMSTNAGAPAVRAADVIASGAGLVYSNVPIVEPTYDIAATYAKGAVVYDPATYNTFSSVIDANKGKALTDTLSWAPGGATNRRAMFDQYNNTQTTAAEEIIAVVSPKAVSQGFYIGNAEGTEIRISVVDLYKGLVYQEVQNLKVSTSGSSFFNWGFKRLRRKTWAVGLKMPPFANALITITIKRPGAIAKCGMCVVGPTMDLGRTLMTLGAEIKDFSDTSFNFDGTSNTITRNWAKRITADVMVDADRVDDVYEMMATLRQRPIVWIGSVRRGVAIAFGRYSTMKPVVKGDTRWDMSLQIEGTV